MNKEQLLEQMKEGIDKVINSDYYLEVKLPYLCPNDVCKYIKEKYEEDWEIETNGWQYDYWIYFTINNKNFVLTGSGFYGRMEFAPNNDE